MKKLGFIVMPLLAVSLLASCGGGDDPGPTPTPTVVHNLVYVYDNDTEETFTEKYIDDEKTKEPTWTPTYVGHTFVGWYEEEGEGKEGTEFTFGSALTGKTTTIHAHWDPIIPTTYTVTFDANGGELGDDADSSISNIGFGAKWGDTIDKEKQVATKEGNFTFAGWGLSEHTPDVIDDEFTITKDFTAYAIYTPTSTATIKLTGDSKNCKLYYCDTPYSPDIPFSVPAGENVVLTIKPNDGYLPIFRESLTFTGGTVTSTGTFNPAKMEIIVNLDANSENTIKATTTSPSKENLGKYNWDEIKTISENGIAPAVFKIGDEKIVEVNGKGHRVRIIGFDQDVDKNGNNIGITFEFANLISDSDGYSIATQWNDTNNIDIANHNYLDSSVRMALVGEKQEKGHILWAQYSDQQTTTWSSTYANKTVLNMIEDSNPGFTDIIVAPKKTVECNKGGTWTDTPIVNNSGEYDKLFLLSPEEMGSNATREGAYTYYQETDEEKLEILRVKKQFNGKDTIVETSKIPSGSTGQEYQGDVNSYAGYNLAADITGGFSWLRSPSTSSSKFAWNVVSVGRIYNNGYVNEDAFAVAPAFCI